MVVFLDGGLPATIPVPPARASIGEAYLAHNVVIKLVDGLWDLGYVVTMDFSSIGLFMALLAQGIYATGTIHSNRVGLLSALKNTRAFKNSLQGTTIWRMHDSCTISYMVWKDKKLVLLLSTHAMPIQTPCEHRVVSVPRRCGAVREMIPTSLVLRDYTTFMQGMDVADQLCASYSCQVRSHE